MNILIIDAFKDLFTTRLVYIYISVSNFFSVAVIKIIKRIEKC